MIGKIVLWAADKVATRVLRQPTISRTIRKVLHEQRKQEKQKNSVWRSAGAPVDFSVTGKRGELRWAGAKVHTAFKAEKLLATDTSKVPGFGTSILLAIVGGRGDCTSLVIHPLKTCRRF